MRIRAGSLLDLSTVDWPGHIAFMLFCSGCNFCCPFCQNASLISLDSGGEIELEAVKERVHENINFLDALGFTGGEPTLQPKPIIALCEWAKTRGLKTFLNTNGSNPRLIEEMAKGKLIDYVALDVKAPFRGEVYRRVAGLRGTVEKVMANIRETIAICERADLPLEIRTTIVPTLIDDEKSIREIAETVRGYGIYVLQEFFPSDDVPDETLRKAKPPNKELLIRLAKTALNAGVREVYIRTRNGGMERITP
ncbi:MAG: anaerobic ribonucleoside-triphosphate reductase activating protein [Candidatus Bathyarchaeota archaeon]|nr:MAG: anaerobic ribonucleoside-triphosphate reductase activating protein [Candidatus Bathyarchaeota archaeon]